MFKHGNHKHSTVTEARECERFARETEAGHAEFLATGRDEPRICTFATPHPYGSKVCPVCHPEPARVRPLTVATLTDSKLTPARLAQSATLQNLALGLAASPSTVKAAVVAEAAEVQAEAFLTGSRPDQRRRLATEAQIGFLDKLVNERSHEGLSASATKVLDRLLEDEDPEITVAEASALIGEFKAQPKNAPKNPASEAWRALAEKLPSGNYAIPSAPSEGGQDKPHFYRLSRRGTFVKLQERGGPTLYPIELRGYKAILEAILAYGVEEAGMLYAAKLGRCRKCGLELTDENNPYKAIGYGPDCGAKA